MAAEKDHGACNNSRCNLLARPTRCRADSLEEIVARSFLLRDSAEDALDSLTERGYVAGQPKAFALTESGRNLFTRLLVKLDKFEIEQLSGILQDLAVMRSMLEKLYDRLRPS